MMDKNQYPVILLQLSVIFKYFLSISSKFLSISQWNYWVYLSTIDFIKFFSSRCKYSIVSLFNIYEKFYITAWFSEEEKWG